MLGYLERLDNRTFLILLGGTLVLIVSALVSYVIWPQLKDYRAEWNTRDMLKEVSSNGEMLERELAQLKQEVDALRHKVHGDLASLPVKQMEAYIIGRLQEMSWRHNVELSGIKPGAGQTVKIFKEILFEVEVVGDYFNLIEWLRELGRELGFVVVKEYEMKPISYVSRVDDPGADEPRISLSLTIVSYRVSLQ